MKQDYYMPLFVHASEPIEIIVINDKRIECRETKISEIYPDRALNLLYALFNFELTNKNLPKEIKKIFQSTPPEMKNISLTGKENAHNTESYFALNVSVAVSQDRKDVIVRDFFFNQKRLNYEAQIPIYEFFLLASNLCVEYIYSKIGRNGIKEALEKKGIKSVSQKMSEIDSFSYIYTIKYLKYIQKLIRKKELKLEAILRTGGINVLLVLLEEQIVVEYIENLVKDINFNKELEESKKLMYHTFLLCISSQKDNIKEILENLHFYEFIENYATDQISICNK